MKTRAIRELVEESLDRLETDFKGKHNDLHYYYLKGLEDAYKYILECIKILEAKEWNLVQDECDG